MICKIRIREYSIHYVKNKKNNDVDNTLLEDKLQQLTDKMWMLDGYKMHEIMNENEKTTGQLEKYINRNIKVQL